MNQTLQQKPQDNREQWLAERRKGIGGSDSAAVCLKVIHKGKPYEKTIVDLYNDKLGLAPERSGSIAMDIGNILEDYIGDLFMKENPDVKNVEKSVQMDHPNYEFIKANIDGIITFENGDKAILEIKTADSTMKSYWDDQVPVQYYLQVQHYMMVTEIEKAYVAVLFGNREFQQYEIERDAEMINTMINEHYIPFWDCVKTQTPPPLEGDALTLQSVKKAYPEARKPGIFFDREYESHIKRYIELKELIKDFKDEQETHQAILIGAMQEAEAGMLDNFVVTYKNRNGIDAERLLAEQPEVFKKYQKNALDTTEFKKKEKTLAKEYTTVIGRTFSVKEK